VPSCYVWTEGRMDMTKLTVALRNTANAPNKRRSGGVKAVYSITCRQSLIVDLDVTKKKLQRARQVGKTMFLKFKYSQVQMKPVHYRHVNFVLKYVTSTQALSPRLLNGQMSHMAFVSTRLPLFLILSIRGQQLSFS
jgi:hypothetical protein